MTKFSKFLLIFVLPCIGLFIDTSSLSAQVIQFDNKPAIEVFNQLQNKTKFRFLYRESLVSDLRLSLLTDHETFIEDIKTSLQRYQLTTRVDSVGKHIIVLPGQSEPNKSSESVRISGRVVDAQTGERLPYSTLSWQENERTSGVVASTAGRFQVTVNPGQEQITLKASFVGYQESNVTIPILSGEQIDDITIRLKPKNVTGSEIIVIGNRYYSPQDTSLAGLISTDRFSPLGESNAIRALQVLPSVGTTTAMNDGLNIRGSTPDGFQLELDGITIFNQSHLFGLLDSFNESAVLNSGFFYDVTPAHINSPIGGKLSLTTRSGSLQITDNEAGNSNTSIKATIGGPIQKGKSSWLISARSSYMNQVNWFQNNKLVRWGLDINLPGSDIDSAQNIETNLVTPRSSDVYYLDIHGKLYFEQKSGSRTMASLYFGVDHTNHIADRLVRGRASQQNFQTRNVETENRWNNFASSVQHQRSLTASVYSNTMLGLSAYETLFSKGDLLYTNVTKIGESLQTTVFTYPLLNRSTMNRVKLDQTFDIQKGEFSLKTGFTGYYHRGEYREESFDRQSFYTRTSSVQADLFLQSDLDPFEFLDLQAGIRTHYYSSGKYFLISPRIKANLFSNKIFSVSAGYSRNHQFINRVGFSNAVTADVWILANETQAPPSVNQFTAEIYINPISRFYLQAESYLKRYENLRSHELNAKSLTNTFYGFSLVL
jgi:hypothetical protein